MKKSVDFINQKGYQNFIIPNEQEEENEEEDQEIENNNFTSLSRVHTANNMNNNLDKVFDTNISSSQTSSNKNIQKEDLKEKKENNSQKNNFMKQFKNSSLNKLKTHNGSFKKIVGNKKIVYIKKRNGDVKDKNENINKTNEKDVSLDIESEQKEKEMIKEIKDSVICYICLMKVEKPRICPNCHKIACEKCLRNWFIDKGNNNCGYCRAILTFDKMISIPIINNVANLIDKISNNKNKMKKIGIQYNKVKKEKNYDISNEIINEELNELDNEEFLHNTISLNNFKKPPYKNEDICLNKKKNLMSRSTHNPYVSIIQNKNSGLSLVSNEEYCSKHPDQPLFYYCLDCNQAYCRTCFVFFGDEKDKHNNHSIIEYDKYKSMNIPEIIKNSNNLDDKYEEIEAYIKRCEALKNCYEFERTLVEKQVKLLMENFNLKIDENINLLDNIIKKYKFYLTQINNCKEEVEKFYSSQKYGPELIDKLNTINKIKYFNSKEIDNYSDLSKNLVFKSYQTKFKKYEIKQNNYHFKIGLEDSKYQLAVTQKANEVQIYIYWPEDKEVSEEKEKNLLPIIFMRKKNKNWECFQLSEFLKYKGNNYYIRRFSANNFCNPNSYFKIKGILYENFIE